MKAPERLSLSRTPVKRDITLILLFNLLMLIIFSQIDMLEKIYAYSIEHEHYELDEIIPLFITISISLALFSYRRWREEKALQAQLLTMATHDHLTGLNNRRGILAKLEQELARCSRTGATFSIIMIDLDDFKRVNDSYGHNMGDIVLKRFAELFSETVRISDTIARWGGDEFLVLCPETDAQGAAHVANKLKKILHNNSLGEVGPCTASVGAATLEAGEEIDSVIGRADDHLYEAKYACSDRHPDPGGE